MSASPRRPNFDRKAARTSRFGDRRDEIVARAAALFDAQGFHLTSMDDVAGASGIAKPTLYHYFSGKDELLFEIHRQFIDVLMGRQEERRSLDLTPSQRLLELMADILELMQTHRGHVRLYFEHHRELTAERRHAVERPRDEYYSILAEILTAGMDAGEFRRVDVNIATLSIFGMCNWAYQWFNVDGRYTPRQIADQMWALLLTGLATR